VPSSGSARPFGQGRLAGNRGTASLEFGLVGAVLMAMLLGGIELGRYMFTLESVRTVTAEAVRSVTIRGGANMDAGSPPCDGLGGRLDFVPGWAPFLDPARLVITMNDCSTDGGVTTVLVTADYQFVFAVPLFGNVERRMTETALAIFN